MEMSNTSFDTSEIAPPKYIETLNDFESKISRAMIEGSDWVETSPEIIGYFNRNGLNGSRFFLYKGIKVCEHGKSEDIEKEMNQQMGQRLFGAKEGIVEGRT